MKSLWITLGIALAGIAIAAIVAFEGTSPVTLEGGAPAVPQVPFDSWVAGTGTIEARGGNISIGTPISGIVMEIHVEVGDRVEAGQPLFKIDDRDLEAEILTAKAQVEEAAAALLKPQHQLETKQRLHRQDATAISAQDLRDLEDQVALAKASLQLAKAKADELEKEIDYHTVRAPVAGSILQLKMRLGEYVEASGAVPSLLILGSDDGLNIRVDVDEYDAWRVRPNARAMAYVRGHPEIRIPLEFEYTEPVVVPKSALQGASTERTDTRVLQILYSFTRGSLPVYIGEQLDVYIEVPPAASSSG